MSDEEFMALVAEADARLDRINELLDNAFAAHVKAVNNVQ